MLVLSCTVRATNVCWKYRPAPLVAVSRDWLLNGTILPCKLSVFLIKILKYAKTIEAEINILAPVTPVFRTICHYFILRFVMCSVIQVYGQPRSLLAETKWKIAPDNVECTCVVWCEEWWKNIKKYSGIAFRTKKSTFVIYKILIVIKWRVFNEEVETVHWQQTKPEAFWIDTCFKRVLYEFTTSIAAGP